MPRSSEFAEARARPTFARRMLARASDGAIAAALVFMACLLALRFAPPLYEAQAMLEIPRQVREDDHAFDSGFVVFGLVSLVSADDFSLGYPEFSERVYAQVVADGHRLRLRCRDADAAAAVATCVYLSGLVADAQPPYVLVGPVVQLPKTVSPVHWPGVWLAVLAGVAGGLLFAAYSAAFRKSKAFMPGRRAAVTYRVPTAAGGGAPAARASGVPRSEPPAEPSGSDSPAPVHVFTVPPGRGEGRPSARTAPREPTASRRPAPVDSMPPVEIVSGPALEGNAVELPRRQPSSDAPPPIQAHITGNGAAGPSGRATGGWSGRTPSASNDSMPAPPMPEGPMVHALAIAGGYSPHPRLVQRAKDPTFDALCTRIAWNAEGEATVVGVIGTAEVGPKSAVFAARLAWFLAAPGKLRVLLLEADLEEPTLHRVMGVDAPAQGGFSQQLQARLGPARREPWRVLRCAPTLDLLVESRFRTQRAAHAPQFDHAVDVFRLHYDVVVAALPPLGVATGGAGFGYLTDGIVVVVPEGKPTREPRQLAGQTFGEERLLAVVEGPESGERITIAPLQ